MLDLLLILLDDPTPEPTGNMLFGGSRKAMEMMRAPSARRLPVRR